MARQLDLRGQVLKIEEHASLADEVGATVWDCSLVLTYYMEHTDTVKDKRVIELGSGTGLVGLAAAMLGASEVLLTDRSHLLQGIRHNVQINSLGGTVRVEELEWGEACSHLCPPFDVILLSDCFYDTHSTTKLLKSIAELSGTTTLIIFAHEDRITSEDCFNEISKHGMTWDKVHDLHPDWQCSDISLYHLKVET